MQNSDVESAASAVRAEHGEVFRILLASCGAQVVRTLASLSVAEHLERGPLTASQIAERACSDPEMTYRVLRAGVPLGLLEYDKASETFTATLRLGILHENSPYTLKHYAQFAAGPAMWHTALRLPDSVRRGHNCVEEELGADIWGYFAERNAEAWMFRTAMTDISTPVVRDAVAAISGADEGFVVDVGGASGTFVGELLQRNPKLAGAVFDLPQALPGVAEHSWRLELGSRMTGIGGNFFESVPAADYYLLKFILHDWNDESCRKILSNVRRAMNPGARVFIVEMLFTDEDIPNEAALLDMVMLFSFTGKEREMGEYEKLLHANGLEIARTTPLSRPYSLIEARAS
jgi:O-methyltransferase domain